MAHLLYDFSGVEKKLISCDKNIWPSTFFNVAIYTMNYLNQQLQQLIAEACTYPARSSARQQKLDKAVKLVIRSNKLWRQNENYYQDALQQTWYYFLRNIDLYDPLHCNVITWLNNSLKWRLKDCYKVEARKQSMATISLEIDDGYITDLISHLPAPPDIPPILSETYEWVKADPDGELREIHIKGYPHATCQALILLRLPPEQCWKDISREFNLPPSTAPNFYKRECLPRLRKFAHKQGYIDSRSSL